jgi:hypothetical protein
MALNIKSNEGGVIRQATAPDVAGNPKLANSLWIKEGTADTPPSLMIWDRFQGAYVCSTTCNLYDVEELPQLAVPVFYPVDGSKTDGFSISHVDPEATIWFSINGAQFSPYPGGNTLFGTPDYFYVAAYAVKDGARASETVVVEYTH